MKKSRFTDSQIMAILKQHEAGVPVAELAREHNVSTALICTSLKVLPMLSFWQLSGCGSTTTNDRTRLLEEYPHPGCGR